jgi:glycosyltransferase involved in cell wall biosynthesis
MSPNAPPRLPVFSPRPLASARRDPTPDLAINGRFLRRRPSGVDRFALETIRALDALLVADDPAVRDRRVALLVPADATVPSGLRRVTIERFGRLPGQLWEQAELPWRVGGRLLLNLCNTAPLALRHQAVVIHDAATVRVPQAFTPAFRATYGAMMPSLGRRSAHVLTVSEFSRRELAAVWGIARGRVTVLPEGAEHVLREPADVSVLEREGLAPDGFVLAVGNLTPHKNLGTLLRAAALGGRLRLDVVIAGGSHPKVFRDAGLTLPAGVRAIGYVSDAELRALYSAAACFVFPSRYEGFGLPPLEAMACGCPVIASSAGAIPETCGDAALRFDCDDAAALRAAIEAVVDDPARRQRMRDLGRHRAAEYTWERTARGLMAALAGEGAASRTGGNRRATVR